MCVCGERGYLVKDFLEVRCSHPVGQVAIGTVAEKELPLGCHCGSNVFPTLYILLTTIYHTNIPCGRDGEEEGEEEGEEGRKEERERR